METQKAFRHKSTKSFFDFLCLLWLSVIYDLRVLIDSRVLRSSAQALLS